MKSLKKSIIMCGVSMALCVGMFAGATFAWFTDSVSNAGNKINSGTLDIEATVQENDPNGTEWAGFVDPRDPNNELEVTWGAARDLAGEPNVPFINDESFEPDGWNAKLITVYNKGDLPAKIKIFFDMQDAGLADSMWFFLSGKAIKFGDPNTFNTGLQPMSKIA